jgi:DNA repair exonuclease SbcCD nuclease subunit
MTRILHTADVHLRPDADERLAALEAVLAEAEAVEADVVTIGGDLFDTDGAAERLRTGLRSVFSDRPFETFVIPGNHDRTAFEGDVHFGETVVPATDDPYGDYGVDGTRIVTVSYQPGLTDDLRVALEDRETYDDPECLLLHCSLEAPMAGTTGDEDVVNYFPVTEGELAQLDFEYYLAGHYHSQGRIDLPNGGAFVYPGTPASVTRAETGRRAVALVDTDEETVTFRELNTRYAAVLEETVMPGQEDELIEAIRSRCETWRGDNVAARLDLDGFTERGESTFRKDVLAATGDLDVDLDYGVRTVENLLEHPIYREFAERLAERDDIRADTIGDDYDLESFHEDVKRRVMEVCTELASEGRLS